MNSPTFLSEVSIATTPAASAVTSLCSPVAMPTVAAVDGLVIIALRRGLFRN